MKLDILYTLGHNNIPYDRPRGSGTPTSGHKPSGTIDVIGASVRDTRRQQLEFREPERKPDLYATHYLAAFYNMSSVHCIA